MRSTARITVASTLLLALAACSQQKPPDCSVPMYNVHLQLKKMAANGQGDKARAEAENYAACFDQKPSYWLMRASLVPYLNGDESHLERDTQSALKYTNHAISLDPDNGEYKQAKASLLFQLREDHQASNIYESVLADVMRNQSNDQKTDLARQGVLDTVVPYIQGMKRQHNLERARAQLTPFVSNICANRPPYVTHYAQTIIWLDQQLNQKSPADVSEACSDFSS